MGTSIESRLSLALAVKLKLMFEEDKKFLTFPLGMGFSYRDLDFMRELELSGLSAKEQLNNKGQFARLLNIIPQDSPQFSYDATQFLWDELKKTLNNSQWAESAITIEEEKKLLEAEDFLTDVVEDNTGAQVPVNSQAVTAYYQYKGIFDDAEMAYLDEKITIETVTEPEGELLKKEWESYREKQLIDAKDKAEQDWVNLGFKREVEHHQQVRNLLEPRKYLLHYREQYLNELKISDFPDLDSRGHSLSTTFFSPSDIFEPSLPWPTINLKKKSSMPLCKKHPMT